MVMPSLTVPLASVHVLDTVVELVHVDGRTERSGPFGERHSAHGNHPVLPRNMPMVSFIFVTNLEWVSLYRKDGNRRY